MGERNTSTDESDRGQSNTTITEGVGQGSRRSFVKSIGAGATAAAVLGSSITSAGAASQEGDDNGASQEGDNDADSVRITQREFDPIWYSPVEQYWSGTTRSNTPDTEHEGAALIRGTLTLNEIRPGDNDNLFSFNLFSFGIFASEGIPESNLENEIGPLEMMHSTHKMTIECDDDDYDVNSITTNYPQIGAELGRSNTSVDQELFKELPSREYEWTTGEYDLKNADTSLPSGGDSLMLGGASLATGAAAGIPTLGVGTAALLTGTSVVLGLSGMIASMDDQGEWETQNEDKWEYKAKETDGFLIIDYPSDISVFSHNLIIDIPVEHYESRTINITDKIEDNGDSLEQPYQDDELDWIQNNETREWTVDIPSYSPWEDAKEDPPTVSDGPEKQL